MSADTNDTGGNKSFIVIVTPRARPDKVDSARHALEAIAEPTRANPDCYEFRIFQDKNDLQSFTLIERWVSLDAVLVHGRRDYMAEYMALKDDIFETPPRGKFFHELSTARSDD
ncbi:putative quinol monooxygenase [Acidisoma silvae]|uniref:Antibiotic biosynthesis monooxygenase n=1 Tax=Acidisoma silvae TaxID=2802396 RepID=A0A963YMP1_9PROT|nr:putative quinol monooxygenase [Acidisoma silvae]MCB8873667.1 antibiotic biosynthesis monooxygenase [Acidisoma silvae]